MQSLVKHLGCGNYYSRPNRNLGDLIVCTFSDISNQIIPFFQKHPIMGVKSLDFADFCKVVDLMQKKAHLTEAGLAQIKLIKVGMNSGRAKLLYLAKKTCFFRIA